MRLKRVWISPDAGKGGCHLLRVWGVILGITLLMMLLVAGGMALIDLFQLPREAASLFLVVIVTALAVFLAIRVGWNSVRNATIFFLTEEDRFFALDARFLFAQRRDILGQVKGMAETKQFLRILSQKPYLPAGADELIAVKKIKENRRYYAVNCRVRHPNRRVADRLYYVVKGYEDEPELLRQLEQRQTDLELPELQESRMPHYILLSAVCCVVLICVCVFSHPAFGVLPQLVYFPCLAAVTVAVFFLLYFILRYRRGE